jgi:hypothetical protein
MALAADPAGDSAGALTGDSATKVVFNRDVRPILSDLCFQCHGPDEKKREGGLRLDLRDAAIATTAIVPGNLADSELVARIVSTDPELRMPPPETNKSLSEAQIDTLRRWIEQGAEYQTHWAFIPPTKPTPPETDDRSWPINPIDRFVLARLRAEGLAPSPEASRETLIRRLSLDLTGLPPTIAEVETFVSDRSPDAYEKLVDRLLDSPRYGERMATPWLDAARYADSNGYQVDRDRELWAWRDWVIRSFNNNLDFERFTIEQLAGDLLPEPTFDQRVATGFNRNHMLNEEGGIIAEEFLAEYTADRVETTAAIWLGQTFNCTRCHDHKFDPFTQADFYSLKAFFHNVPEQGVGSYGRPIRVNAPPYLKLPAPAAEAKIAELTAKQQSLAAAIKQRTDDASASLDTWAAAIASTPASWQPALFDSIEGNPPGVTITPSGLGIDLAAEPAGKRVLKIGVVLPSGPITAIRLALETSAAEATIELSRVAITQTMPMPMPMPIPVRPIAADDSLPASETAKLLDTNAATRVTLKPGAATKGTIDLLLESPRAADAERKCLIELDLESISANVTFRLFATSTAADRLVPTSIATVAKMPTATRSAAETKQLLDHRLAQDSEHARLTAESDTVKKGIEATEAEIPTTLVMEELPKPRETFVLMRGVYDKQGDAVTAATPGSLPPMDASLPRNRLGLARWLVGAENPLTARVTVNRIWEQFFGVGLVATTEDFGSQGSLPSDQELLDWLAVDFREGGWDIKRLIRQIVGSATYRQSSIASSELLRSDPQNRLLARGPRFRLPAESIRDQAIFVSGLLVDSIGGPAVKPYHPPGLYEQVTAGSGTNVYVVGQGNELFRRSLYTYWKRSVPHPAMLLFDAPFRESCTLRRPRSNTPLQALNLMNDPTFVEAAEFLAARMIREGGDSIQGRLAHGFRLVLARDPSPGEWQVLRRSFDRARADFAADPEGAKQLLAVGSHPATQTLDPIEHAAYATVAATLLNLDETITKE